MVCRGHSKGILLWIALGRSSLLLICKLRLGRNRAHHGFPMGNVNSPCPMCFGQKDELYETRGYSPLTFPHAVKTLRHYEVACATCEVHKVLSASQIRHVRSRMVFEKRRGRHGGRVLVEDIPSLGLLKGDALCPTSQYPDIGSLCPEQAPRACVFWRPSANTITRYRNPLFAASTGVDLSSIAIDWLRCMALGVFQHMLGHCCWAMFNENVFDVWDVARCEV